MPLRDHFRPPLDELTSWDMFHGQWPAMIVLALSDRLPPGFAAGPNVHLGSGVEVEVAAYEGERPIYSGNGLRTEGDGAGIATAVWTPPEPTSVMASDLLDPEEYEVRVYDNRRGRRLVAAVEIVSPANKNRPEHRRAFVAKCSALLQARVSVTIVDLVTTRTANLFAELLDSLGMLGRPPTEGPPPLYAVTCRSVETGMNGGRALESWAYHRTLGQPLPTLPLWLAEDLAIPLELEPSYEETCRVLRIP